MGMYLNPGNSGFAEIRNATYVDKSGLLCLINSWIGTQKKLVCSSRPRRFGKSYAAKMLCAYYDRTCDSHALFDDLAIARDASYEAHINNYDVICIDVTGVKPYADGYRSIVPYVSERIIAELAEVYPCVYGSEDLATALNAAVEYTGRRFVVVIDEWDALIREAPELEHEYLEFLRSLFKNTQITSKVFAAAYMTGILPIHKDGSQSAISDFWEYTIIEPGSLAPFVGFTEAEVARLCDLHHADFQQMKRWYDGYELSGDKATYNPNSVIRALETGRFASYWTQTSATDNLLGYISQDFEGLSKTVAELLAGIDVPVDTTTFPNSIHVFRNRDELLTLLVHLGYLTYDSESEKARIPNEEIRLEFASSVHDVPRGETVRRVAESVKLIEDTVMMNADAVAAQIERVHEQETTPLFYNNEAALCSVVKLAYFAYKDHYLALEELPRGSGYADIVYLPKKSSQYPALVVELKWNESAEGAIAQIKARRYPSALEGFGGDVLLVGISYDKDAPVGHRVHRCVIERA